MVIMIIFLILSVVLVIGTAIYLNYKKKNINRTIPKNSNKANCNFPSNTTSKDKTIYIYNE